MKSDCSAPSWLKFFMSAGIQKDSAETYAVTFSKNQIQLDMLPEIKKEYLVDMGITLMGHIIAILRHAKTVHTEEVTKSTLSTTKSGSSLPSKTSSSVSKPVSKTTPILVKEKAQQPASAVSKPAAKPAVPVESARTTATMGPRLPPKPSESSSTSEKRRPSPVMDILVTRVSGPSKPPSSSKSPESPVKRKLASDESAHADESETKKRIFQRLGQVTNSSSSDPPSSNGESVFSRLGQKTPEPPKPAISVPKVTAMPLYKIAVPPQKVTVLPHKVAVKPIISLPTSSPLTRHIPRPGVVTRSNSSSAMITDPKKKVMMLNQGVLTKTMRADQDVPSKILSSTTLSAQHTSQTIQNARMSKNRIYSRLGVAAMDQVAKQPAAVSKVKRVSFGTVSEKTIPPVRRASFPFGETTPIGLAPYRKKPIGANGVFSRLGI